MHGSCLCQSIQFTIAGELRSPRYCHCENCRKFAGSSPAAWAMAETAILEVTKQEAAITKYDSGRGLRCFCSSCGSPLWFESLDYPDIIAIPLGVLDDEHIPAPCMHIWTQSRVDWIHIDDIRVALARRW